MVGIHSEGRCLWSKKLPDASSPWLFSFVSAAFIEVFQWKTTSTQSICRSCAKSPVQGQGRMLTCLHNIQISNKSQGAVPYRWGFLVTPKRLSGREEGVHLSLARGTSYMLLWNLETEKWIIFMTWVTGARAGAFLVKEAILNKRGQPGPHPDPGSLRRREKWRRRSPAADDRLVNQLLVIR